MKPVMPDGFQEIIPRKWMMEQREYGGGGGTPSVPPPPKPPLPAAAAANAQNAKSNRRKPQGFGSTILTSGLGAAGDVTTGQKSLLGG
jgi:hypothetical protein